MAESQREAPGDEQNRSASGVAEEVFAEEAIGPGSGSSDVAPDMILAIVRQLRRVTDANDFSVCLNTMTLMLSNILSDPQEPRYRSVRLANPTFQRKVGRFEPALQLLRLIGFEDATQQQADAKGSTAATAAMQPEAASAVATQPGEEAKTTMQPGPEVATVIATTPTHLALPETNPARLAQGLVLMDAAAQAAKLVESDEAETAAAQTRGFGGWGGSGAQGSGGSGMGVGVGGGDGHCGSGFGESSRAAGKRPMREAAGHAKAADGGKGGGKRLQGDAASRGSDALPTAELEDFSAAGIGRYFAAAVGSDGSGMGALTTEGFERLYASARDAALVAQAASNAEAEREAARWLALLSEHAVLVGWTELLLGEAATTDAAGGGDDGDVAGAEEEEASEGGGIGADGNLEACAVCAEPGLLVCCDACPRAYHAECLRAPPSEDDEDAWFCPTCATAFSGGAGPSNQP